MGKSALPQAIVVHAGARDNYQLALALQEGGLLKALVTNVYWDRWVLKRYGVNLDRRRVHVNASALAAFCVMKVFPRCNLHYFTARILSLQARALAYKDRVAVCSCSYSAFEAFSPGINRPFHRFLFQLHPHPRTVKKILEEELDKAPFAKASLLAEAELSWSPATFEKLASEPALANGWLAASSYTAQTLAENGIGREKIHVIPYGVDFSRYPERQYPTSFEEPLTVVFLGSLIQRKGLSYLLEAIRMLRTRQIHVLLMGRGPDQGVLTRYKDVDYDVRLNLSSQEVVSCLRQSDLFVFPSLCEGFAHVILQAMACGLPFVATDRTCAPDVATTGTEGFVIPAGNAQAIADKIVWGLDHREELVEMGRMAARTARGFTWERFRSGIRFAYSEMCLDNQKAAVSL